MQKLRVLSATFWENINVKILNHRLFKNTDQHFATSERLKSNEPLMFKLPAIKLAVSFHHFCISDVNKTQTKIAVLLNIHFLKSYCKLKITVEV